MNVIVKEDHEGAGTIINLLRPDDYKWRDLLHLEADCLCDRGHGKVDV